MDVVVVLAVDLVLTVSTMILAASHNRPFDVITKRSDRQWWLRELGIRTRRSG